jgi:hypothetical protein
VALVIVTLPEHVKRDYSIQPCVTVRLGVGVAACVRHTQL